MAYELQIRGTQDRVKIRSPWAAALLPFVTFGIYHLVWWYRVHVELRDYGKSKGYDLGQNPTSSLLALFPGGFIVVPAIVTYWRGVKRIQGAARVAGREPVNGWLAVVLYLVLAPALSAYLQSSLNDVWNGEADPIAGQAPPPQPASAMPPRLADDPTTPPGGTAPVADEPSAAPGGITPPPGPGGTAPPPEPPPGPGGSPPEPPAGGSPGGG